MEAELKTYEGMFLLNSSEAVKDWDATVGVVNGTLERYGASMKLAGKWDERKLAYHIKKQRRGTYYLAYFDAPPDSITSIRADLQLREEVLRFLILALPEGVAVPETVEPRRQIKDDEDDRRRGRGGERRERRGDRDRDRDRGRREERSGDEKPSGDATDDGEKAGGN